MSGFWLFLNMVLTQKINKNKKQGENLLMTVLGHRAVRLAVWCG